jgi:CSLREA domain-containing protein
MGMAKRQRRRRRERRLEYAHRPAWQTRHSVITGAGIAASAALGLAAPALADSQTFDVTQTGDSGDGTCDATCTLRDAIQAANANASQYDYVVFQGSVTGNVALTQGEIPITDAVYIYGNGPDVNTITADANSRIFNVNPNYGDFVAIHDLTLTGGDVTGDGGAITNDDGVLSLVDTVLSGNTASGDGGAIYESGNYYGGAYDRFRYATFSGNHAASGGAIYADSSWGTAREATFNDNHADGGSGGAISGSTGYLVDSTISGNSASVSGGGAAIPGEIHIYGSILANNLAGSSPDLYAPGGGYGSFDLIENATGLTTPSSIITGVDPQLGALGDNGGPMPTMKPAAGSPVVDQSNSYSYYDQRLGPRIVDNPNKANAGTGEYAGADIGAVELSVAEGPQATPVPPPPGGGNLGGHRKCKKKKHKRSATVAKKKCKKKHKRSAGVSRIRFAAPPKAGESWPDGREQHPFRLAP